MNRLLVREQVVLQSVVHPRRTGAHGLHHGRHGGQHIPVHFHRFSRVFS